MLGQYNDILAFSVTVIKCMTDHIMDAIPMCTFYIRSHSHFLPRGGGGLILISPFNLYYIISKYISDQHSKIYHSMKMFLLLESRKNVEIRLIDYLLRLYITAQNS
jgi:hypothetical protein